MSKDHFISDTLGPEQNGRYFADNIFKFLSLKENFVFLFQISIKFVPYGPVDNKLALVSDNDLSLDGRSPRQVGRFMALKTGYWTCWRITTNSEAVAPEIGRICL